MTKAHPPNKDIVGHQSSTDLPYVYRIPVEAASSRIHGRPLENERAAKVERMRQSARDCRKRKKMYVGDGFCYKGHCTVRINSKRSLSAKPITQVRTMRCLWVTVCLYPAVAMAACFIVSRCSMCDLQWFKCECLVELRRSPLYKGLCLRYTYVR